MSLQLLRIDERLIHGQVLVGWGNHLGLDYYVIVDDALASSEWEQEIWASALSDDECVEFLSVAAAARLEDFAGRAGRGALLTRDTAAMRVLAECGCLDGCAVNVGGLHPAPGREKVLDYVHLSPGEREDLRAIGRHCRVSARDLPTAPEVSLEEFER
ncbi:PTS sugar transporter subunit IIB [Candidatus Palauibacter sp.]|uniref:PTS sugar transporter subunit IIB n=1 Tax=Candidatus Palauibacter sp. TaxID=3101350 RepID=UPI003AF22248